MAGMSSRSGGGQLPGLTLRAWALVNAGGALVRGANVTSVTRNAQGNYTLNLATPMADTNVILKGEQQLTGNATNSTYVAGVTAAAVTYFTTQGGAAIDVLHLISVYGS